MEYKLTIYGNNIYKEIELDNNMENSLCIGTTSLCQIRFNRENFFDEFEIFVTCKSGVWTINCNLNSYFSTGNSVKQYFMSLKHGDRVCVRYEKFDTELFRIEFMFDYERSVMPYDYYIDISRQELINIGGHTGCQVILTDSTLQQDYISLKRSTGGYVLDSSHSRYGVLVNGYNLERTGVQLRVGDFFSILGSGFYITNERLYLNNPSQFQTAWPVIKTDTPNNALVYPKFIRNARVMYEILDKTVEILPPQAMPQPPKKNLLMTLVPVIASLVLIVVLRGVMGGSGTFILYSAAMMVMGGVMSVWNYFNEGKDYKKSLELRQQRYNEYIIRKEEEIQVLREKELGILRQKFLTVNEDIGLIQQFDPRLYDRRKKDADFLVAYLGQGTIESERSVKYKKPEYIDTSDVLQEYPGLIYDRYCYVSDAPVTINLKDINCAGITGNRSKLYQLLKNMTMDLAARHFYQEVKFFYILSKEDANAFRWMRWLKHTWNDKISTRNFMYNADSEKSVLEYLYSELSERELIDKKYIPQLPHIVIFIYRSQKFMLHPVSKFIDIAASLGVTFLFFEEHREYLPQMCQYIIYLNEQDYSGTLQSCENGELIKTFTYNHVPSGICESSSLKLSCVYVDEVSLESTLTHNISLFKLMDIMAVTELDLKKRWEKSHIYESMAAPVGIKSGDEIVYLDLHEKFHGPHGLVAGTTGSGKSEILQTYILSMATLFHPYEVGFVIIDFKGGGMVNQFKNLPHMNGAITNIDGREITRSLLSIKAELRKRQTLFAEHGVNHIDAYIKMYKKHEARVPLPHLILIVDEFAELKNDQPEFMKELISTARIGRSLGVHLILATQKPSGVVDSQIWSNSKFKLCLKVQSKEDSNEVLKSPLAAEIKEPGRAYLQVGNNEVFTLFQSAYSGASVNVDDDDRKYEINRITLAGERIPIYVKKRNRSGIKSMTQLDAIVKYIGEYCQKEKIQILPGICLPPLEDCIAYEKTASADSGNTVVTLGVYDDPDNQRQDLVSMDLLSGHVLIIGSSQYGKTSMIQLMLRRIAENYKPSSVWMYILDFGSMALKVFESLNHVGGVVLASEDEKLKNLLKMLSSELKHRKEIFSGMGITSFISYREAGYTDMPHMIVFIDNFLALRELYPDFEDELLKLCREGIALGITLVLTSLQTSGINYKYMSNLPNRICLYCNQKDEYGNMFDHCRMQTRNIPGRGLVAINKNVYEYQNYLAFEGEKEIDRVSQMKQVIAQINAANESMYAAKIPMVPEQLTESTLEKDFGMKRQNTYAAALGVDYDNVKGFSLDLYHSVVLGALGEYDTARKNFINGLMYHLYTNMFSKPSMVYILDDTHKGLKKYESCGMVERYSLDANDIIEFMEEIHGMLEDRMNDEMPDLAFPLVALFIENREAIQILSKNGQALKLYKELTGKLKDLGICIIFSNLEDAPVSYGGPEILKMLKEQRRFMYFGNLSALKLTDVPNQILRSYKKEIVSGDAYYINGGNVQKIRTANFSEEWMA